MTTSRQVRRAIERHNAKVVAFQDRVIARRDIRKAKHMPPLSHSVWRGYPGATYVAFEPSGKAWPAPGKQEAARRLAKLRPAA